MQRSILGRTDLKVSRVCLGTMTYGEQNTEAEGHAQMDMAVAHGVNFFDTAELYAIPPKPETFGETERIIGTWFKARANRDQIVLATKIAGRSEMSWFRKAGGPTRITPAQVDEAVEGSLKRLQTDYIDLYQIHWPDRAFAGFGFNVYEDYADDYISFAETLQALQRHVDKGSIRHIGVSNESAWGVMSFLAAAERDGLSRIVSIQNAYNLVNRSFEGALAEVALREQVGLLAYSPLGQGYLSGKYRDGALPAGSRKALFNRMQRYETPEGQGAINRYLDLAAERGITPEALALKFCDTRPFVTSTIIGATTLEQLRIDLDAFDLNWSDDLEAAITALHIRQPNPCP